MIRVGIFGSCQLHLCSDFFLNEQIRNENNLMVMFSLPYYIYDSSNQILDYKIFDDIDLLIIENNNLYNEASSQKIILYCNDKNIRIIRTVLIKFPIFPINWSGKGENINDYINWGDINKIDYVKKFDKCIASLKESIMKSDLSLDIYDFIKDNFNKRLLFTHSLHPTNILLHELWKSIFFNMGIDINNYRLWLDPKFKKELIDCWHNPFTTKMIKDLDIQFITKVDDDFYVNRFNMYKEIITNYISM